MDLGNWLSPVIVLFVTLLLITKLFSMMEKTHQELNQMKETEALLQERETIARELHDGIAQSLFLLSVKVDELENNNTPDSYNRIKKIIYDVNVYVRQAITNLRTQPKQIVAPWLDMLHQYIDEVKIDTDMQVDLQWHIRVEQLTVKEKVELAAIIRECLINVRKHADASRIRIVGRETETGWSCVIADNGHGFAQGELDPNKYGIQMMKDRAAAMAWIFTIDRKSNETIVEISKETVQ
jgi:nitrate/nitrite-specific signal transduction histidine kinase